MSEETNLPAYGLFVFRALWEVTEGCGGDEAGKRGSHGGETKSNFSAELKLLQEKRLRISHFFLSNTKMTLGEVHTQHSDSTGARSFEHP